LNATESTLGRTSAERHRGRRLVLLIVAIFAAPVIASWILYLTRDHWSLSTGNHGELIQPVRPLMGLTLQRIDDGPLTIGDLRGKWTLVYIGASRCDTRCRESLYKMRQVRLALGEDMRRVERVLILTDQERLVELQEGLKSYPGMVVAIASQAVLEDLRRELDWDAHPESIFVIDPLGNLMMRYDAATQPKGMLQDLERLLKVSRVG
jgi:cytochrome oxidase Cu insertion factor (SCO1/SenC/PrrC family)